MDISMLFISTEKMELYQNSIELRLNDWRMINLPIAFNISGSFSLLVENMEVYYELQRNEKYTRTNGKTKITKIW